MKMHLWIWQKVRVKRFRNEVNKPTKGNINMSKIIHEQCPQCNKYTNVTELEEMLISELKDEDYIMISNASEKKSKKIKILTLIQYFNLNAIPQMEQVIRVNNKKKIDSLVDAASLGIFDKMMK